VLKQLADGFEYGQRAGQELIRMPADSDLPENEQGDNERDGAEPDGQARRPRSLFPFNPGHS
jgi:hypothetical protein